MLAAAIDGHRSGSTTSRSAPIGVAPRSSAPCSISGLMLASRLRTTTVTKGMQNAIMASSMVRLPSTTPSSENRSSVATAVAVSGATSRTTMVPSSGLVAALAPRCSPSASSVPTIAHTIVVTTAISTLTRIEACQSGLVRASWYHWVLKPVKFTSERVELSENSTTTASGVNMNASTAITVTHRNRGRSNPFDRRLLTPIPPSPRAPRHA